ncbi:OLD family endonuclease [Putridiphycobacter roseus]|uniref:OLD family endonuclease n=1 Tax=Putridiphycobacter roseus TaxID=2219161 RepID=A0A2W1N295_9FLAO|nr:AAA family ATPase [Putridiphycobacter roseus]PZE17081.1 OLD family endonuclease [Putridiphycobacter roseus]
MSRIRINSIEIMNYRSFGDSQDFVFPNADYKKPIAIVGYNNTGKTNLMNSILFALQVNFVSKDTFTINDFHNRNIDNVPGILLNAISSVETKFDGVKQANLTGHHFLNILTDGDVIEGSSIKSLNSFELNEYGKEDLNYQAFGATRYFNIFYINFHNIKEEIVTQKTSWGNLKSFLGKHIQKIVETDVSMAEKKERFEQRVNRSTKKVLEDSNLEKFIDLIRKNYVTNLRNDDCTVDFGLPNYEDIFLKMMFKIGLNGDKDNLVPIDHFGDGYISMFVMAVIQAIAESNTDDRCLFLFEEPESFLHENHQEYFYKTVLCGLSEKGHQVIYTTHSDKMIDPFDTKGLIRLEMDEKNQTVKKYNNVAEFNYEEVDEDTGEVINYSRYNEFIKTIEPNLNRMLFSRKVILVEGPNDVLVYKYAIKQKVLQFIADDATIENKEQYADAYMNFENISIVCHHGKGTANYLIELCKHFSIDYFVINDWDFDEADLLISEVAGFSTLADLKADTIYIASDKKAMITTNWNLINASGIDNIHFNVKKLETVIGYSSIDKSSIAIWELLNSGSFEFDEQLFPEKLETFIGLRNDKEAEELEEE